MQDEKNQQPEESLRPYRLQLVTGTGKVLWQSNLPWSSQMTAHDESVFLNAMKWVNSYVRRNALVIDMSPDSSS